MKKIALFISAAALMVTMSVIGINVLPAAQAESATKSEAVSSEQTATFTIEKMTCAACPVTVKKAMQAVEGVSNVNINFAEKTATVVFDPAVATVEQVGAASTNAGYPAMPER